jgi:hypothetical protein
VIGRGKSIHNEPLHLGTLRDEIEVGLETFWLADICEQSLSKNVGLHDEMGNLLYAEIAPSCSLRNSLSRTKEDTYHRGRSVHLG